MPEAEQKTQNNTWGATLKNCFFGLNVGAIAFAIETNMFMQSSSAAVNLVQMSCSTRKLH